MAQEFTLRLHNPDLKKAPDDIIYTGLKDGNKLNLEITNNSGFDLKFDSGAGTDLLVKIAKEVIDAGGTNAITVKSPWATDGTYTPDNDPDAGDKKNYYVLKLKMADSAGLEFPNKGTVTVALETLKPTATGSATIIAGYDFGSGLAMSAASQISVLSSGSNGKTLIGPNQSLLYTLMINQGNDTNSIVATSPKVVVGPANAAENIIQVNLFFLNPDNNSGGQKTMGGLVPSWDANNPPTFKLRFPYFNGQSPDPAYADLTDDFKTGEQGYNAYTSAWNIKLSLDKDNPNITSNNWWKITPPDPGTPSPYWLLQPTTANKYLFTGTYSGPDSSGPFLDLYFTHIYTNLPVSTNNPETQIILETLQFPGFNDNVWPRPLFKEDSVQILSFGGQVQYAPSSGTVLTLTWTTKNADHCFIQGDATQQGANASGKDYTKTISNSAPLASFYTLTAYDKQGVSKISRTIYVQWKADDAKVFPVSGAFNTPTGFDISPSADKVYVAGGIDDTYGSIAISILDGQTLVASPNPIILPDNQTALNVAATPDNTKIMVAGLTLQGDSGKIYGYTTSTPASMIPGSPLNTDPCNLPNLYAMAVSSDSSQLLISAPFPSGVPQYIEGIGTSNLKPSPAAGNPAPVKGLGPIGLTASGANLFCPIVDGAATGGLGVMSRSTLAPVAGSPITLRSDPTAIKYTAGPLIISKDGKTVTTLAQGYDTNNNYSRVFILCQVDIPTMKLTRRVQVYNGYGNSAPTPTTDLLYSVDENYIFVFGLNYNPQTIDNGETLVSVFDAVSLKEVSWSPVAAPLSSSGTSKKFVVDMRMAPDGSRIYALTLDSSTSAVASGSVCAFIPYFPA